MCTHKSTTLGLGHGAVAAMLGALRIPGVRRPFEAARALPRPRDSESFERRCAAAITKRASAASSARASVAGGATRSEKAFGLNASRERPLVTLRGKKVCDINKRRNSERFRFTPRTCGRFRSILSLRYAGTAGFLRGSPCST